MRQAAPEAQELARRLLAHEARDGQGSQALAEAAERTLDKLRLRLSPIFGAVGFQALLTRGLTLAKAQFPWLSTAQVREDGALQGLREAAEGQGAAWTTAGLVALLAHLLGLLIAFIGENLTLELLREFWPDASLQEPGAR